jgi:hypothetical protein
MPYTDEQRAAALETAFFKAEHQLELDGEGGAELPLKDRAERILKCATEDRRLEPRLYRMCWFVTRS